MVRSRVAVSSAERRFIMENRLRETVKTCGSGGDGGDDRDCEGQRLSSFSLTLLPFGSFMTRWIDQSDRSVWALVKALARNSPIVMTHC